MGPEEEFNLFDRQRSWPAVFQVDFLFLNLISTNNHLSTMCQLLLLHGANKIA